MQRHSLSSLPSVFQFLNFIHVFMMDFAFFPLQFDSLLDVCSSLVVIWRFCGVAGKTYSWERERRYLTVPAKKCLV